MNIYSNNNNIKNLNDWNNSINDKIRNLNDCLNYKTNLWYELDYDISKNYNINDNIIISLDIEFQNVLSNNNKYVLEHGFKNYNYYKGINELGALVFFKFNNKWVWVLIFHINMPFMNKDIDKIFILNTDYVTLSDKNNQIISN